MPKVTAATSSYVDTLTEKFGGSYTYSATAGRKNDRVSQVSNQFGDDEMSRSVHAFVERDTGAVFMAAGWSGPAKGARGSVATPEGLALLMERAAAYGGTSGYLYL